MPEEDLPRASDIIMQTQEVDDLTPEQREQITELFDELEVAHDALAKVSSTIDRLSRSLSGKQLLTVLRASIWPLIQINALGNFWRDHSVNQGIAELPEDIHQRVKLTMIPDPTTEAMIHETVNSPTQLLAAILGYKLLKKFGGGTTQREIQEKYGIRPKQLA